jgi:putative ABC transport system permease protein
MKHAIERLRRRLRRDREWQEEIESHLALRADWNRAQGMAPDEARLRARRQFGSTLRTVEEVREVYVHRWLDHLAQDARQAVRSFRKAPAFSIVAAATIALGVGASTAVFSAVDPILFRHLPYPKDDQLVSVGFYGPVDNNEFNVDSAYLDWRTTQTAFQSLTPCAQASLATWLWGTRRSGSIVMRSRRTFFRPSESHHGWGAILRRKRTGQTPRR